ncbi:MAG: hypothetical protein H5U11_12940 [Rhizobium sp.]|nr:hypothetical protein [Rhizobium sp.]
MATWLEDIVQVLNAAGGEVHYSELYAQLGSIRGRDLSLIDKATVRKEVERFSADSDNWNEERPNLFRSTRGKGKGFWSLVDHAEEALSALQIAPSSPDTNTPPERREILREITLRDTRPVRKLKALYGGRCQVSGELLMEGVAGDISEVHHIKWLTRGGLDIEANMVVVSPTFHAAIHAVDAEFDWETLTFIVSGKRYPLVLNKHLQKPT